jgi:hypothetical protein
MRSNAGQWKKIIPGENYVCSDQIVYQGLSEEKEMAGVLSAL